MKPRIAVTGGNGLVGSRFIQDFADTYEFVHLDINHPDHPVDITNASQVLSALEANVPQAIIHFAAYTDVTGAWKQSGDTSGSAYRVNVTGTEVMVQAAEQFGAHFIHISTAYVFDGTSEQNYTETDTPHPIEWYGETKLRAERAVLASTAPHTVFRIDQPFRPDTFPKADVVHRILAGLANSTLYPQFTDHFFGPTVIPDFAKVLDWAVRTKSYGLYHATSGEAWTDYDFARAVAEKVGYDPDIVKKGSLSEYLKTSERPYQKRTALDTTKLTSVLDFTPHTVQQALSELER